MPWEDEPDYDEPGSGGGGDSHEDEFDEEYGEQQPKGDPNAPDTWSWERQYGGQIDHWEDVARKAEMAETLGIADRIPTSRILADPVAQSFDPAYKDAVTANAYDPDDFDYAESADPAAPPTPGAFTDSVVDAADISLASQAISSEPYQPVISEPVESVAGADGTDAVYQSVFDDSVANESTSLTADADFVSDITDQTGPTDFIG